MKIFHLSPEEKRGMLVLLIVIAIVAAYKLGNDTGRQTDTETADSVKKTAHRRRHKILCRYPPKQEPPERQRDGIPQRLVPRRVRRLVLLSLCVNPLPDVSPAIWKALQAFTLKRG